MSFDFEEGGSSSSPEESVGDFMQEISMFLGSESMWIG